jgi:hypothetical protein
VQMPACLAVVALRLGILVPHRHSRHAVNRRIAGRNLLHSSARGRAVEGAFRHLANHVGSYRIMAYISQERHREKHTFSPAPSPGPANKKTFRGQHRNHGTQATQQDSCGVECCPYRRENRAEGMQG